MFGLRLPVDGELPVIPCISRPQLGLLCVFFGTFLLAFSVKVNRQYQGAAGKAVDEAKERNPGLFEPTEAKILLWRFRAGLALVALGTALQW